MDLVFDLESIPTQREDLKALVTEGIKHPGNMSKPETIAEWEIKKKPALIDQAWRKTALNGAFGELICIGWALKDFPTDVVYRKLGDSEAVLIRTFLATIKEQLTNRSPYWIGHNITGFDLRFLWQRCVINNICPPFKIPFDAKPWDHRVFDTRYQWAGISGTHSSLNDVCKAMGYPGKGEIDGSMVWDYVKAGREEEVARYCRDDDVEQTRMIYKRMTFQN